MRSETHPQPAFAKALAFSLAMIAGVALAASHKSQSTGASTSQPDSSVDAPASARDFALRLKINTDLVQIPVTVTDKADQIVSGLARASFTVYEDGVEQTIAHFGADQTPVSVCLVFDTSLSMSDKISKAVAAVNQILDNAAIDDEYCLIRFSDSPVTMVELSDDPTEVAAAMQRIHAGGLTALLDAIYVGTKQVRHGRNRHKAIVVISDGGDNRSRHTEREIKQLVREADVQVFSIGVLSPKDGIYSLEEINGPALMKGISRQSGGRLFRIRTLEELPGAIAKINLALRHQYVLGYYPKETRNDGKYHHVAIKLSPPKGSSGLKAYWRSGYYAPKK